MKNGKGDKQAAGEKKERSQSKMRNGNRRKEKIAEEK